MTVRIEEIMGHGNGGSIRVHIGSILVHVGSILVHVGTNNANKGRKQIVKKPHGVN